MNHEMEKQRTDNHMQLEGAGAGRLFLEGPEWSEVWSHTVDLTTQAFYVFFSFS